MFRYSSEVGWEFSYPGEAAIGQGHLVRCLGIGEGLVGDKMSRYLLDLWVGGWGFCADVQVLKWERYLFRCSSGPQRGHLC